MRRIVLTGGPVGGKSSILYALNMHYEGKPVVFVPEAANLVLSMGVPHPKNKIISRRHFEELVLIAQTQLQNLLHSVRYYVNPKVVVYDRTALDCLAFWPDGYDDFFSYVGESLENLLSLYDCVIHLPTLAKIKELYDIHSDRMESAEEAVAICNALREIYKYHRNYHYVNPEFSWEERVEYIINIIDHYLGVE